MTGVLRQVRLDEAARDWQKTGLNELGDLMRGDHDTRHMADQVLCYLAVRLGAQMASFLLADGGDASLSLAASYAMTRRKELGTRIGLLGLAEQAIRERKTICIVNVPVGVIELASFTAYSDAQLDFIERARERIAVGFDVNLSRHRMHQLLARMQQYTLVSPAPQEAGSIDP